MLGIIVIQMISCWESWKIFYKNFSSIYHPKLENASFVPLNKQVEKSRFNFQN